MNQENFWLPKNMKKKGSIVYMHNDIFLIIYNYCLTHQSQYQLYIQTWALSLSSILFLTQSEWKYTETPLWKLQERKEIKEQEPHDGKESERELG